ncbi:MAG TPA: uracil-DNA glycosylase [Nitrososphaerales archaeon]|nr:uracil-DNA glycosylase [Nitrososphaerales archaeon]
MTDARNSAKALMRTVIECTRCPRLVSYREGVLPRASFASQRYWRKPVPGFGDLNGRLLVLGLAPALHGGNRTGRVFTGDSSGRFLVKALYDAGFANNPISESLDDGLVYTDCYVTAVVKCVPPGDKPAKEEFENCSRYLDWEISLMKNLTAVLALGALSFKAYLNHLNREGVDVRGIKFSHGGVFKFKRGPALYASYHPSPRNTNTGKLTPKMLVSVLRRVSREFEPIREMRI